MKAPGCYQREVSVRLYQSMRRRKVTPFMMTVTSSFRRVKEMKVDLTTPEKEALCLNLCQVCY